MSHSTLPLRHALLALAVVAVWGTNFVVIKVGLAHLPPLLFAALRFTFAFLPAALFIPRPAVRWRTLAAYGVFIGLGQFGMLYVAMNGYISPGLASLVVQTQVVFTIGLSMRLTGERVAAFQIAALALAGAGLAVIGFNAGADATPLGLALVLIAAASWAGGNMVARGAPGVNILAFVVWASLFSAPPLFALVAGVRGLAGHRPGRERRHPGDLGGPAVAVGRQHPVRLCRVGVAAGAAPGGDDHPGGPAGPPLRDRRGGAVAGRGASAVEDRRRRSGAWAA